MKPENLLLRCYAKKEGDQWEAFCIDLCLATSGATLPEAKQELRLQIKEYIYDAIVGEDKDFAEQLLTRKARLSQRAIYNFYKFLQSIYRFKDDFHKSFKLPIAIRPLYE